MSAWVTPCLWPQWTSPGCLLLCLCPSCPRAWATSLPSPHEVSSLCAAMPVLALFRARACRQPLSLEEAPTTAPNRRAVLQRAPAVACIRMSRREKGTFYHPMRPTPNVRGPLGCGRMWETWVCSFPEAAIAKHQNWAADGNRALLLHSLEARSPNSRRWRGHAPSDSSKGRSFLVSSNFWCFPAILGVP